MPLEHPRFCKISDKIMLCAQNFPKNNVTSKLRLRACLAMCLKQGQSQPKCAYKARAYLKK